MTVVQIVDKIMDVAVEGGHVTVEFAHGRSIK
jgi:hypothetical protein